MDFAQIATLLGQFGPLGVFVAYLVWRENKQMDMENARVEATKALAQSLGALTAVVQRLDR